MRLSSARWRSPETTYGGSWTRIAPSLSPSGPTASSSESMIASRSSRLGRRMRPLRVVGGRQVAQRRRQAPRLGRVAGDELVRLHVEAEAGRRPLGPGRRGLDRRQRVEAGVHLHHREAVGVVAQARLGVALHVVGVPARLDELRVGPGGRAHPDPPGRGGRHPRRRSSSSRRRDSSAVGGGASGPAAAGRRRDQCHASSEIPPMATRISSPGTSQAIRSKPDLAGVARTSLAELVHQPVDDALLVPAALDADRDVLLHVGRRGRVRDIEGRVARRAAHLARHLVHGQRGGGRGQRRQGQQGEQDRAAASQLVDRGRDAGPGRSPRRPPSGRSAPGDR